MGNKAEFRKKMEDEVWWNKKMEDCDNYGLETKNLHRLSENTKMKITDAHKEMKKYLAGQDKKNREKREYLIGKAIKKYGSDYVNNKLYGTKTKL